MKRIIVFLLLAAIILAGCGKSEAKDKSDAPKQTVSEATPEVVDVNDVLVDDKPDASQGTNADLVNEALKFVDKPLSEFIAAYGEPLSSEYAPSCLGDGEDGTLKYEHFTVYTYKEGEKETVLDVR